MKLDPKVRKVLEDTGLPWCVETGTKHYKVRLNGRLVAIYPQGKKTEASQRANLNVIANIKRLAREMK